MVIRSKLLSVAFLVITLVIGCAWDNRELTTDRAALKNLLQREDTLVQSGKVQEAGRSVRTVLASAKRNVSERITTLPTHQKVWRPEYAVLPLVEIDGWDITIRSVRNNYYRSLNDYDVRHYDLSFPLSELQTVDFIVVPFQASDLLAHTMLAFGLQDGRHFLVSVEARLEKDEAYSTTAGMRREFELMYVIGDERDLIPLRTRIRKVECFLYPGRATPDGVQKLFLDIAERVNQIARRPEFYNTLTNNCTTNLVDHVNNVFPNQIPRNDWRLLLPGRSDRLAFELGLLNLPTQDFESMRPLYRINDQVASYEFDNDFSVRIRQRQQF